MARRRFFIGRTQEWLEAELLKAQEDLAAGTTSTGGSEGDSSFQEMAHVNPGDRIDALLYELSFVDPAKYPARASRPARTTRGIFRG
jgi:hypothetical protein